LADSPDGQQYYDDEMDDMDGQNYEQYDDMGDNSG
jgi:hypothetical protein